MPPQPAVVLACLVSSGILLALMHVRSGGRSVLFFVAAFFALFAFGPVVNHVLGNTIYAGIRVEHIDEACVGFTLALAGLALADAVPGRGRERPEPRADPGDPGPDDPSPDPRLLYQLHPPLLALLALYGAVQVARLLPIALSAGKIEQIALAGPGHRIYLLVELCAVSTYFLTRRTPLLRRLWAVNAVAYVAYCLVTSERDFLFVLFTVVLFRQVLVRHRKPSRVVVLAGVGSVLAAALLSSGRAGEVFDLTGVLNQGSLLFVDTFVIGWVPERTGYSHGGTYLQTVRALAPGWLHDSGAVGLSEWLVDRYAPGSGGGYGFSLSAEAHLNFGPAGVLPVFLVLGLAVRAAVDRFGRSEFGTFFAVHCTAVVLYALRGDSSQLVKSALYGAVFFLVLRATSGRATGRPFPGSRTPAPRRPGARTPPP